MSAFPFPRAYRRPACGAFAALGLGLRLWAQAPVAVSSATANTNWQFSAQLNQGWDSDPLLSLSNPRGDSTTQLQLTLGKRWAGRNWSFDASYTPEGMNYTSNPKLDYIAQSYQQDWTVALGPHTQFSWTATAQRFPERSGGMSTGAGVAALASTDQTMALAMIASGGNTAIAFHHQSSLRSTWNANLTYAQQWYSIDTALAGSAAASFLPGITGSHTIGGGGGWSYQLAPQSAFSLTVTGNQLWYGAAAPPMQYANLQASISQGLGGGMVLKLGAGPSWNHYSRPPAGVPAGAQLPSLGYAASASLLAGDATSGQYGITWDHAEQMGQVPGGVTTDSLAMQYAWQWGRNWSATTSIGENRFAGVAGSPGGQESVFASGQLSWRIASAWSLRANATYSGERLPVSSVALANFRREQYSLGLQFQPGGAH